MEEKMRWMKDGMKTYNPLLRHIDEINKEEPSIHKSTHLHSISPNKKSKLFFFNEMEA